MIYSCRKYFYTVLIGLFCLASCKKNTFDINSPNPNLPSSVSPKFALSAALTATAYSSYASGFTDFANRYMGYWAFSGDYGGYGTEATYNLTTAYGSANWDYVYSTILVNYKFVETSSSAPTEGNFLAIAKIMEAFHYGRLVDIYNNVPYSEALKGGVNNYPTFDDAKTVYASIIHRLDSAIAIINATDQGSADNPGSYDVMFGGNMTNWKKFANSVKLKLLLNLTQSAEGPALIQSELAGVTTDSLLGVGIDAAVNPGYSNSSATQQNPEWQNVGFQTGGATQGGRDFNRANSYAVNFYTNTHDPRLDKFYNPNTAGVVRGRAYGSTDGTEHNTLISAVGPGILQTDSLFKTNLASGSAYILPAFESLFFQAEALQRGYITAGSGATVATLYQSAVSESFRLLFSQTSSDYAALATAYTAQPDTRVNFGLAADKITLIVTQEWAALNMYDPITAWNNWKRLGIPADLPVSIYPGVVAPHIPIRLLYPTSEYSTNSVNVNAQGTIDPVNSKIFWMP